MFNSKKELTSTEVSSMKIGSNIAALRKEKGITQEELANALGVSAQAVSKWENNSSCPDVSLLTVIADYFGVTVDALLRSGAEEITRADTPSTDNNVAAVRGGKRNVRIKVTQPNGKEPPLGRQLGCLIGHRQNERQGNKCKSTVWSRENGAAGRQCVRPAKGCRG